MSVRCADSGGGARGTGAWYRPGANADAQRRGAGGLALPRRARITAAEKARELAEQQLDAERKKFQLGSGQIRFVLQEQTNLTAAQVSEIQALVNYTKALVEFDRAIGRTLKRNNIVIDSNQRIVAEDGRPITGAATPGK